MSTASAEVAQWFRSARSKDQIDARIASIDAEMATKGNDMLSLHRVIAQLPRRQAGRGIETLRREQVEMLAKLEDLAQARWLTLVMRPLASVSQVDRVVRYVRTRGVLVTANEVASALPDIPRENVRALLGLAGRRGLLSRPKRGRYGPTG